MSNPKHLAIAIQGSAAIERWRSKSLKRSFSAAEARIRPMRRREFITLFSTAAAAVRLKEGGVTNCDFVASDAYELAELAPHVGRPDRSSGSAAALRNHRSGTAYKIFGKDKIS